MLPTLTLLRNRLAKVIEGKGRQGHDIAGLSDELESMKDDYNAFADFAARLAKLPMRSDWAYVEPDDLDEIWAECDPDRPTGLIKEIDTEAAAARATSAWEGTVAGCILGKPLEVNPTLEEIRKAAEAVGEWPLNDYVTEGLMDEMGRKHGSTGQTTRGNIHYVAPDDDLNYRIIGMLVLEQKGVGFTKHDLMDIWLRNLPPLYTFGPERTQLIKAAMRSMGGGPDEPFDEWADAWNPMDEWCGALIRADAFGYACLGRPALAAEMAWRDSSWTHRRTGIYGTMWVAAAIASAAVMDDRMEICRTALQFIPRRSRFHEVISDCLNQVVEAKDWLEAYERIHDKYREFSHCRIYQEVGTLINTMRFAKDVGDGICMQVMQGNDTDCFGATIGSMLGAYFGPGHLEERWLAPFNDRIHTGLAAFHEQSLSAVTKRMAALPGTVTEELNKS